MNAWKLPEALFWRQLSALHPYCNDLGTWLVKISLAGFCDKQPHAARSKTDVILRLAMVSGAPHQHLGLQLFAVDWACALHGQCALFLATCPFHSWGHSWEDCRSACGSASSCYVRNTSLQEGSWNFQGSRIDPWPLHFWKLSRYTSHFYRDTFAKVCRPLGKK